MLSVLQIENFALIDHLELEFGAGLNVLTGPRRVLPADLTLLERRFVGVARQRLDLRAQLDELAVELGEALFALEADHSTGGELGGRGKLVDKPAQRRRAAARVEGRANQKQHVALLALPRLDLRVPLVRTLGLTQLSQARAKDAAAALRNEERQRAADQLASLGPEERGRRAVRLPYRALGAGDQVCNRCLLEEVAVVTPLCVQVLMGVELLLGLGAERLLRRLELLKRELKLIERLRQQVGRRPILRVPKETAHALTHRPYTPTEKRDVDRASIGVV